MRKRRENLRENFKLLEEKLGTTNKGITLIALVVTIVVLLILASVSITVVFGDNGILELAKEAGEKTNEAVQNDKENIGNATNYIKSLSWDTTKVTAVTTKDGGIVPVPKGFVASEIEGENTIKDGFVIYEIPEGENLDWKKDKGENGEENGILDVQENFNQFVWVPADGVSLEYKQDKETWKDCTVGYNDFTDWTDEESEEEKAIVKRAESVAKYGGFYVARYEAGVPESKGYDNDTNYQEKSNAENRNTSDVEEKDLPASKKGLQSWNCVTQKVAKELSSKMYENKESVKNSVTSRLIDSYAWDTICHWFSNSGIDVINSASWGNYVNSDSGKNVSGLYLNHELQTSPYVFKNAEKYERREVSFVARQLLGKLYVYELATGISERNKAKNIYDFAGNMWEWTTETRADGEDVFAVSRGSDYADLGDITEWGGASCRRGNLRSWWNDPSVTYGFRTVLYLK